MILIHRIIWFSEVEEKISRKHNVQPREVEQVLNGEPYIRFMEPGHRPGENLYAAFGQTDGGRYLVVFYLHKGDDSALIVTARDMTPKERRYYGKSSKRY